MDQEALVEGKVADSIELVTHLDSNQLKPTFAAWYYYDDANEWRFILAIPSLDAIVEKQEAIAYRKVVEAINALSLTALAVSDLKLLKTTAKLPSSLRMLIGTGPDGISRIHCKDNMLNGLFVKEVLILRSAAPS
jgi:hypothetical protein